MALHRFALPALLFVLIPLIGCDGSRDPASAADPAAAYEDFFRQLARGNTQQALEQLAPEGALGNTFQGAGYYMLAETVGARLEEHGGLSEIVIDQRHSHEDESITVEGRLILRDGTEVERRIRFSQEQGRWVGRI